MNLYPSGIQVQGSTVTPRSANLSPLMLAKNKASRGEKVNACPFGCQYEGIDEHGYCRHLIGTSFDPFGAKLYEPMIVDESGRRVTRVPKDAHDRPVPPAIPDGCQFERITNCYRVYCPKPEEAHQAAFATGNAARVKAAKEKITY